MNAVYKLLNLPLVKIRRDHRPYGSLKVFSSKIKIINKDSLILKD